MSVLPDDDTMDCDCGGVVVNLQGYLTATLQTAGSIWSGHGF